jgi:copper chaperone CopZ
VEGGFTTVGKPLMSGKSDEITIKNVHVCCGGCEKAIKGAIKEGDVSFEGSGPQKTVRITGKELDVGKVFDAVWQAGYSGTVEFKK